MSKGARSRNWCFTLNNFNVHDENDVFAITWDCRYIVCGKEVGENGTPHLQGYVCFKNDKSFNQMKDYLPTAHWESSKGSPKQASEYCKKEGDFYESGELPIVKGSNGKLAAETRWELAKSGRFEELSPESIKVYEYIYQKYRAPPTILDGPLEHEWWYGKPGTGKTRKVYEDYPNAFYKDPKERWWDGYVDQEVVVIDDFDKYQVSQGGDMKRWLDRYPFQAPIKGGYLQIRPRKIIVTSNYHPDEIWEDNMTQEAIGRRVKVVRYGDSIF